LPPHDDDAAPPPTRRPPPPPGFSRRGTDRHVQVPEGKKPTLPRPGSSLPKPGGSLPKPGGSLPKPGKSAKSEASPASKSAPPVPRRSEADAAPPRPPPPSTPVRGGRPSSRETAARPPAPVRPPAAAPSRSRGNTQAAVSGIVEVDAELEHGTIAVPGRGAKPSNTMRDVYAEDAAQAVGGYRALLEGEKDPKRAGRLHYEVARLCERMLGALEEAAAHYHKALELTPDHLATVVGARRLMLRRGEYDKALELYDREIRVTPDRARKAALMFAKARVLEDHLKKTSPARELYRQASELSESDPALLKALEQTDLAAESWDSLGTVYARVANAVGNDVRHRANLVAKRARLLEVYGHDSDGASELYEAARGIDPAAPGALDALKRLHYERKRWRELIRVLEHEAEAADDPVVRIMALYRVGQIQAEHIGNRREAIVALERASKLLPIQPVVLEALARLYEAEGQHQALAETLSRLVESTDDLHERLGYLHRIGEICRDQLGDDQAAIRAYEAALSIDPGYIPALRALAPMYAAAANWGALVQMHEAEVEATDDKARRATAHARAAEILERIDRKTESMAHHEHALALDPELESSFRALIRLYTSASEHHKLIELYERALDRVDAERRVEYLFAVGDIYRGPLADPAQAEYAYKRVLRERPKHLGAVHALQRTAEAAGRHKQLVEALDLEASMISDNKQVVTLLHRAGEILHEQMGDRNEAIRHFRKVLALEGHHVPTLASLGRIYHDGGLWADLIDIYERELHVTAEGAGAVALLHKMGEVHARFLADTDKAIESFRKALDLEPRHGPTVHALGRILREREQWEELVKLAELERDSFKDPGSRALASYRAGELYETRLELRLDAERCYSDALEMRPSFRPAADALVRVRSHLEHWKQLARDLESDAGTLADTGLAIGALLRAGEVWWDHLRNAEHATRCYEKVLDRDPDNLGALLSIEPHYRKLGAWQKLAQIYERQVLVSEDDGAKVAALRERARLYELHELGERDDLIDCYTAILAIRPDDALALAGLEQLALDAEDPRVLASVDARLANNATDPLLRAAYVTRQAECLEQAGNPQALALYREALRADPQNRAALRGMSRLAEVIGDGEAMIEAARGSAEIARDPDEAAEAWVRSGIVQVERMNDHAAAIQDFERALGLWPDHEEAAMRLGELMRDEGRFEALVEWLSRAANEAKNANRQSALWIEVAQLHADDLSNYGAALSVLQRLVKRQPKNAAALLELGGLLVSDRRYDEAIPVLRNGLSHAATERLQRKANILLATAFEGVEDVEQAFEHFEAALATAPTDRKLLRRMMELQLRSGMFAAASDLGVRLLETVREPKVRAEVLLSIAQARTGHGKHAEAIDALAEAVVLEGSGGRARTRVVEVAGSERELWSRYVDALRVHVRQHGVPETARAAFDHEIACVQLDRLEATGQGMQTLVDGLRTSLGDVGLRFELAKRLRAAKRLDDAVEQFQYLLMDDVVRVEGWRFLAQTFEEQNRPRERLMALAGLTVMEHASAGEIDEVKAWQPRTSALRHRAFEPATASDLFVARDQQAPIAALLSAISDGLGKLRPPDLGRWGVGSRDKIAPRSEHPLRGLVDHLAAVFGVEDIDVYLHRMHELGVGVENTSKPSLMIPLWAAELPRSQQVFLIARALVGIARGTYPLEFFNPRELTIVLAAAVRTTVPGFGERVASGDVLDEQAKLIARGVPRRKRKALEVAAETYARTRNVDVDTFVQCAQQTSRRIALVVADDLLAAVSVLRQVEKLTDQKGLALVNGSPIISDLLKVWVSRAAMALRVRGGLITNPSLPAMTPQGTPAISS
jgi:cellulose synthase operon protein C